MKTIITILFAKLIRRKNKKWISNPIKWQAKTFDKLISSASNTSFGKDHAFSEILSYDDFKKKVPIRDYEALKPYVDKVVAGEKIFYGLENHSILLKRAAQLLEQNIFL